MLNDEENLNKKVNEDEEKSKEMSNEIIQNISIPPPHPLPLDPPKLYCPMSFIPIGRLDLK